MLRASQAELPLGIQTLAPSIPRTKVAGRIDPVLGAAARSTAATMRMTTSSGRKGREVAQVWGKGNRRMLGSERPKVLDPIARPALCDEAGG